jgi:hypothetical protein
MKYQEEIVKRLYIHNDGRTPTSPSPFDFNVDLSKSAQDFKNVSKVSIIAAALPKIDGDDAFFVSIEQVSRDGVTVVANGDVIKATGVFYFDNCQLNIGDIKPSKGGDWNAPINISPYISFTHLRVRVLRRDGSIVALSDTNNINSFSMIVEFVCHSKVYN